MAGTPTSAPAPASASSAAPAAPAARAGLLALAARRLRHDRVARVSLVVVIAYLLLMLASWSGLVARDWSREVAVSYAPPSWLGTAPAGAGTSTGAGTGAIGSTAQTAAGPTLDIRDVDPLAPRQAEWDRRAAEIDSAEPARATHLPLGADKWGRDVLAKAIKGTEISLFVGLSAALLATLIGTALGACAGFLGGWVDDALEWFYSVFTAIPGILLILAFAAVLRPGIANIIVILGLTGWTGIYRLVRAEYLRHRARDYVRAAEAIGAGRASRMFLHILPNVAHVSLVQLSQHVVGFIKAEVILSFLGFGVPLDRVSWGTMLAEAQSELVTGQWWQLLAATVSMAVLVTAFSLLTDALRDALDPRLRGVDAGAGAA
jgi:peptide/nickel transport system permease protein